MTMRNFPRDFLRAFEILAYSILEPCNFEILLFRKLVIWKIWNFYILECRGFAISKLESPNSRNSTLLELGILEIWNIGIFNFQLSDFTFIFRTSNFLLNFVSVKESTRVRKETISFLKKPKRGNSGGRNVRPILLKKKATSVKSIPIRMFRIESCYSRCRLYTLPINRYSMTICYPRFCERGERGQFFAISELQPGHICTVIVVILWLISFTTHVRCKL